MKFKDLSNFTWDELSYFTWQDLSKGKLELLEQARQDTRVPPEVTDKLYDLCQEALKEIEGPETKPLENLKMERLEEVTLFLKKVLTVTKIGYFIYKTDGGSLLAVIDDLIKYLPQK